MARAARDTGTAMVFSNQASRPMEGVSRILGDTPRWFQLYWSRSDELVESLAARAERCGCQAIVVTLDTTMLGWRSRDLERAYLPFLRGKGIAQYTSDPVFTAPDHRAVARRRRPASAATQPGRAADADRADPRVSGPLLAHAASRDAAAPRSSGSPRSTRARH